ncbi:MAG: glycoside hydrolase family 25 protein [Ruminococcus sp.]|jgi:GH25 family lysozyme M1 (1,4-beta-N-acetylmuramidase)|nr:glycoside hydrolase family 25 protein [Ruminococcus sp.]
MEKKLIDVSKHNGTINWKKVKADGIEGVIVRAGYGRFASQKDTCFESNYAGARAAGLIIGAYWYSYAISEATARAEAEAFLEVIRGKSFELPVYIDIEDQCQLKLSKAECTAITDAFCGVMEKAGYFCGVYSFDSFFASHLNADIPKKYSVWAARVENQKPTYVSEYDVWQYSWKGNIDGITGHVDMNVCYKDFPSIMFEHGLNNCTKNTPETVLGAVGEPIQTEPGEMSDAPVDEHPVNTAPNDRQETVIENTEYTVTAYRHHVSEEDSVRLVNALKALGLSVVKKAME